MTQLITREALKTALDRNQAMTLVEVLPEWYFNDGHLPNAVQINHDEVDAKAATLLPNKSAKIVVYCTNGNCNNSTKAAIRLTQLGYTNVYKYAEGKQDWIGAGLPMQKGGIIP